MTEPSANELAKEIAHLRELRDIDQAALRLQAVEYERRLDALNHAHEEARAKERDFVTVGKFDDNLKAERTAREVALERVGERTEGQDERISALENWKAKATGAAIILTVFAGVIGGAIVKVFAG